MRFSSLATNLLDIVKYLLIQQLEVFGWGMGDADGKAGFAKEDDDDTVAADAFDFSFDATEGTAKDADSLTDFVEEVAVGEGNALVVGVGQGGGFDEVLHGTVGHVDDFGALRRAERGFCHELDDGADGVFAFQLFDFPLLGMDEDEVAKGGHGFVLQLPVLHYSLFGEVQVVVHSLSLQFVAHAKCSDGIAKADAHGVPPQDVVVLFFERTLVFWG